MKNSEILQEIYQNINSLRSEMRAELRDELTTQLKPIRDDINEIKKNYVLRIDFEPVKRVVYGAVGVALVSLLSSLLYLVLKK